jgi:DNA-binding GntR family transcriptional regulator
VEAIARWTRKLPAEMREETDKILLQAAAAGADLDDLATIAAAVTAVFEALGKKRGPEDDRNEGQRFHDALAEACELLTAA